jgi:transcriptional regulator with XRE-family HTH domain
VIRRNDGGVSLKAFFLVNGITAKEFASELDVKPETLSRWINGKLKPSRIAKLAIEYRTQAWVTVGMWE